MPANGTANLIPISRGVNPRVALPNHKERGPGLKTKIRRFLKEEVGSYIFDGKPITREDRLLLQAIADAEDCEEPIDRHRALNIILDRSYGKPEQSTKVDASMRVTHEITGRVLVKNIPPEQYASDTRPRIMRKELLLENTPEGWSVVPNPEFNAGND